MVDKASNMDSPTKGIWKRFLVLIPLVVVLAVGSYLYIRTQTSTYTAYGRFLYSEEEVRAGEVTLAEPGIVEVSSVRRSEFGTALVEFHALRDGSTEASFTVGGQSDVWLLDVRNGAVIAGGIDFNGWHAIQVSICICLFAAAVLFASILWQLWRIAWYGYTMVAAGGGLLFCLFQLAMNLGFLFVWRDPALSFYLTGFTNMASYFAALSIPFIGILALLVSLSNIALIRHEGFRPVNLLGIAVSVFWAVVIFFWIFSPSFVYQPGAYYLLMRGIDIAMATAITFGECLLLSTMLCAWLASRHVPKHGVDYLAILGCGIRADGTPCPLLAGRVDRAVDFDAARVAAGDAPAMFVPSGGQGPDEPVSEAQSMGTYLQAQRGIPQERIVLEDRSTTTRENMAFTREVIERHAGRDVSELRVGFSTTNYHVFRGYVCAHLAGMPVEGMGSKTKYYFWPNAFLREFVGLLVNQWKSIVLVYAVIVAFYLLANYVVAVI